MAVYFVSAKTEQEKALEPQAPEGYMECCACSHPNPYSHTDKGYWVGNRLFAHVFECQRCKGVQGDAGYRRDADIIVQNAWHEGESLDENQRYYDIIYIDSTGQHRKHGWFDLTTRKITQTG